MKNLQMLKHVSYVTMSGLAVGIPAFAGSLLPVSMSAKIGEITGLGANPPMNVAISIISVVLFFVGIIVLALIIYGGLVWMTAQGDEAKVEKAQGILKGAIIGLLIVLASYGIASWVFSQIEVATGI